jgi:dCTP deaminase
MGLKPDHWIRKMALEHGMIEPFVEKQQRNSVISYGVSSYGYDMRVADEFKVFQPQIRVKRLSDFEKGYVAGILDSDSVIEPTKVGGAWAITVTNRSVSLLEGMRDVLGVGQINPVGNAPGYALSITRVADVQYILGQVWPYLLQKRDRAVEVLKSEAVTGQMVDPKNFDDDMTEDFSGDVCIIPPNSFALARTVEYFRIPRNVLTITVGKSTYARAGIITNVTPFEPGWEGFVTLEISNTTPLPARIYANEGIAQVIFFEADEECEVSYADKQGKYQGQIGVTPPRLG